MTDGTSQGLFIVVAIVIFGIFVVLAYILFEDTLSPALANMFTTATEQAQNRLSNRYSLLDTHYEFNHNHGAILPMFAPRGGTVRVVDNLISHNGISSIKASFTGDALLEDYGEDMVLWLDTKHNKELKSGQKLRVSFYARSEDDVTLYFRSGGIFNLVVEDNPDKTVINDVELGNDWKLFVTEIDIRQVHSLRASKGAIVFFTTEQAEIWLNNVQVHWIP